MRVTLPALCGLRWVECAPLSDGFLFSDAQALAYANRAGGTRLLEFYAKTAAARGYGLAVTDAVLFEVLHGKDPVVAWMERELAAGRLTLVSTQEIELLELHREGRAPPHYQPRNAGERSIIEAVTADSKRAPSHAIFSDDRISGTTSSWPPTPRRPAFSRRRSSTPTPRCSTARSTRRRSRPRNSRRSGSPTGTM
jgi:hypothetical protein